MRAEDDPFQSIGLGVLADVTGGRVTHGPQQADPKLLSGIGELAKAVQSVGQNLAAVKEQTGQQTAQMFQQIAERKRG
jgi:hypothetical protein